MRHASRCHALLATGSCVSRRGVSGARAYRFRAFVGASELVQSYIDIYVSYAKIRLRIFRSNAPPVYVYG